MKNKVEDAMKRKGYDVEWRREKTSFPSQTKQSSYEMFLLDFAARLSDWHSILRSNTVEL